MDWYMFFQIISWVPWAMFLLPLHSHYLKCDPINWKASGKVRIAQAVLIVIQLASLIIWNTVDFG